MSAAVEAEELRVALGGAIAVRDDGERNVVLPRTTNDVAAVLRLCSERAMRVEIAGAGTKRAWGGAVEADVVLETCGLHGVREHSWQDLTATVGAGTTWAEMQRVLGAHGQMVALDPLWAERATVGGVLATNDSGGWRLKYGSARDLVIGMTLVLADGTVAKTGGKVVKNVAGYDLHKLMIGAYGTLGVITETTFRLHPVPRDVNTFTVSNPLLPRLATLMNSIRDSHIPVQALQLRGDSYGFHLDVQLLGYPEINQHENLAETAEAHGLSVDGALADPWRARESLFVSENAFVVKATMTISEIDRFGQRVLALGGSFAAQSVGTMTASFEATGDTTAYAVKELREEIVERGGSLTILKFPTSPRSDLPAFRINPTALPLMRVIKRRFDSGRILNRGLMGGV